MNIELCTTTGTKSLDDLLLDLITRFETSFSGRIRSYYLGGSSSDGTTVVHDQSPNSSDLDLFIIFRKSVTEDEKSTFQSLLAEYQLISPIQVDAHAYSEDDLLRQPRIDATQTSFLNALIRVSGLLLYGDNLSAELPPISFPRYVLDVIESGIFHLGIPREQSSLAYPLTTTLLFPLTYPDPAGPFYGYDLVPTRSSAPRGTRVLVALTTWIATLILALETGRYAAHKSQSIQLCKTYLPKDSRTQLSVAIYDLCKGQWRYQIPDSAENQEKLRDLCRDTLALENAYLKLCHNYVLARSQQGLEEEKLQIARILQNFAF